MLLRRLGYLRLGKPRTGAPVDGASRFCFGQEVIFWCAGGISGLLSWTLWLDGNLSRKPLLSLLAIVMVMPLHALHLLENIAMEPLLSTTLRDFPG